MRPKNIGIIGGTFTGNRGAEAMLRATIQQLKNQFPQVNIHVLTYYPKDDRQESIPANCFIHSATPKRIATQWFFGSIILRLFPFLKKTILEKSDQDFFRLINIDMLLDIAGVSFIDGREIFLLYNVLSLLPFLMHGVPVFKLSQAMGPFHGKINSFCAKWILRKLRLITARGQKTYQHLKELGLADHQIIYGSDVSFLLEINKNNIQPIELRPPMIGIIPSSLVADKASNYISELKHTIENLIKHKIHVKIIVHSWRKSHRSRNNDLHIANVIAKQLKPTNTISIIGENMNAIAIREEIATCRLVLTSRFHGMIAALATETPVLVIGWSHKYQEVLEDFGIHNKSFTYSDLENGALFKTIYDAYSDAIAGSRLINNKLPQICNKAKKQFKEISKLF